MTDATTDPAGNGQGPGFTSTLDAACRYAEIGWPVFPCRKHPDKQPLTEHGFKDASTDEAQVVKWWRRWPDAQVGVATEGANLTVIDLDLNPAEGKDGIASFSRLCDENGLHGCGLIASTPRGGRHYVYLGTDPPTPMGQDILPGSGIDVRAAGSYIIVPSPASPGREWAVGDPFVKSGETDVAAMPAWVRHLVTAGRARGNPAARSAGRPMPLDAQQVAHIRAALDWVENDSRANWIRVGMALKSTGAKEQAYELWVEWSRRTAEPGQVHAKFDAEDQAYQWRSIREFRLDGSEITLGTLFHLAMQAGWTPTFDQEVALEPMALAVPAEPAPVLPMRTKERPFPLELVNCPGLLGDMVEWMVASSTRRQPALCLASAIVSLGALLGRRVATPSDLRTNVYALGIGETASGKDPSIKLPQVLFAHAGLSKFIGPGEWKSDSGLRAALVAEPSHVCLLDEFTKALDTMSGRQVPPHIKGIKSYMLKLFTTANGVFLAPAYADRKLNAPVEIGEPNLGIYGTGVPSELFTSLDRGAVQDGFLNRFLVFFVDDQQPARRQVGRIVPPPDLVNALKALDVATRPKGKLHGSSSGLAVATGCRIVPHDDAAAEYFAHVQDEADTLVRVMRGQGSQLVDLWVRMAEHVAKLALIRSVANDPTKPTGVADVAWAHRLVVWCIERTMAVAEQRVADSPQEALTKRVLRVVTAAGPGGMTSSQLCRATQWLRRGDRKDIVQTLVESGELLSDAGPGNLRPQGGGVQPVRYVAAHLRQAQAAQAAQAPSPDSAAAG